MNERINEYGEVGKWGEGGCSSDAEKIGTMKAYRMVVKNADDVNHPFIRQFRELRQKAFLDSNPNSKYKQENKYDYMSGTVFSLFLDEGSNNKVVGGTRIVVVQGAANAKGLPVAEKQPKTIEGFPTYIEFDVSRCMACPKDVCFIEPTIFVMKSYQGENAAPSERKSTKIAADIISYVDNNFSKYVLVASAVKETSAKIMRKVLGSRVVELGKIVNASTKSNLDVIGVAKNLSEKEMNLQRVVNIPGKLIASAKL